MYIKRSIESTLASYLKQFKVVLLTGPRQAGKTTLLMNALPKGYEYITLDDMSSFALAVEDPAALLNAQALPIAIDEVQQAPQLFKQAKYVIDAIDAYGSVVLTGSQTYQLMQGVTESLAGRVGILELPTLSLRELKQLPQNQPFIPSLHTKVSSQTTTPDEIWDIIHHGSMPRLQDSAVEWNAYYTSYVKSYLERDVYQLIKLKDERLFYRFMIACIARTGQLLNMHDIAKTAGVDIKTIQGWLSILQASNIIYLMQPFWTNTTKRLTKTPKLYVMDTGLACFLGGWNSANQLKNGAMAGHLYETFVVTEILKSYMNNGKDTRTISFYRDAQKREIDLVIQDGHTLHPVEIKMNVQVNKNALKNFSCLEGFSDYELGCGNIICQTPKPYLITQQVEAISPYEI